MNIETQVSGAADPVDARPSLRAATRRHRAGESGGLWDTLEGFVRSCLAAENTRFGWKAALDDQIDALSVDAYDAGRNDQAAGFRAPPLADPDGRQDSTYDNLVELRQGYVWPKDDDECWKAVWGERGSIPEYAAFAKGRKVLIQAGGNCGLWPYLFARHFDTVYTFEPDPLNFYCLTRNTQRPNIVKFQGALGNERQLISTKETWEHNVGAHIVVPGGDIPTFRIDDLGVAACDLIQLDIEGSEYEALLGARETIAKYRPVIILEMKGNAAHFGRTDDEAEALVISMGYRNDRRVGNDVVFMPIG